MQNTLHRGIHGRTLEFNILLDMKMYGYMIYVDITLCNREPYNLHMVQTPDFTS